MSVATPTLFAFDNSFVRELEGLYEHWTPSAVPDPAMVALNEELAVELGADPAELRSETGVAVLAGNVVPDGAEPVAQAYSGHQFGQLSPRLGDGRAVLLGEVEDRSGRRRDLHMKGSGRTPFARGGDGKAALGPMLREYLIGEAMHGLGIPTTRALAVVATGEQVRRETLLPGAVLTRAAASHLRVGTFQYAALQQDRDLLVRLADHAIARHHPAAAEAENPYLALFDAVADVSAELVARWMLVGFVHGVMNTDNTTISGETIDYGPCAFIEVHDPATVYSSIDHGGRYAYGNQPSIMRWNLARLAEPLLGLISEDHDEAVEAAMSVIDDFPDRFRHRWNEGLAAKLGFATPRDGDASLADELLASLTAERVDHTRAFRSLSAALRGGDVPVWAQSWWERVTDEGRDPAVVADEMDAVNPIYIARNHLVEEALAAGSDGDLGPFEALLEVLADPFSERRGLDRYAQPAPDDFGPYVTFCGT